jgi:hypothetical protein
MNNNILCLQAKSPEDLKNCISAMPQKKSLVGRYAALAIHDAKIITRSFRLASVPPSEIEKRIYLEAVGVLSLPIQDIVLDYQIFKQNGDGVCGIFSCLPRPLFCEYLNILDKTGLVPSKITVQMLSGLDSFFLKKKPAEKSFCFLDFSSEKILNLSVYQNKEFSLLRQIPFENVQDVRHEVLQSLRSVVGQGNDKKIACLYVAGQLNEKDKHMITEVAELFGAKTEHGPFEDSPASLCATKNFITLNLARHLTFCLCTHRNMMMLLQGVVSVLVICFLALAGLIVRNAIMVKELKSSYTIEQYQEAQKMEKKLTEAGYVL